MSAILTVQQVEKSFGPRQVLAGVSCAVHEHDRIGLVGLNGAGKSTLLRLMVRGAADGSSSTDDQPDRGLITRKRGLRLEYVPQEPKIPDGTVLATLREGLRDHSQAIARLEALEAGLHVLSESALRAGLAEQAALHQRIADLGGWDRDHEIREMAAALDLPPFDARVGRLSGGEVRRVALGRALLSRPELLALDEPTNHLDAATVVWLEERLTRLPGALLLVTHDRYFLDRVATRIFEIDRGALHEYEGGYTQFLEKQAERLANEGAREDARRSFVRRELSWIRRGAQARSTKQKARIDRFNAAVANEPTGDERRAGPLTLKLSTGGRLGKTILELRSLGASRGGRRLFSGLDLIVKPGDRIGIVGPNGAGKTTLVKTLLGLSPPDEGQVVVGQNTKFAYLDQARGELRDDRTVIDEVADGDDQVFLLDGPVHVRTFLRMLLFDDRFGEAKIGTLSGGERNRVLLARLLRQGGNVLILDEPTNDLDLVTLGVLEEALIDFGGCALVVSHDRWFLDKVATAILAFESDGRVLLYEGDYSSYLARRPAPTPTPPRTLAAPAPLESALRAAVAPKLTFKEKEELLGIERAITDAEAKVAALEAQLADPEVYRRKTEVTQLAADLETARGEVEQLYARWQTLEDRKKVP